MYIDDFDNIVSILVSSGTCKPIVNHSMVLHTTAINVLSLSKRYPVS